MQQKNFNGVLQFYNILQYNISYLLKPTNKYGGRQFRLGEMTTAWRNSLNLQLAKLFSFLPQLPYTGRFIMFSVITNIYNKKTKGPILMELFTATGKLKKLFFWQLEMFDVCTTGDTAHIDTIFKFLPHTRVNMGASIFFTAAVIRGFRSTRSHGNGGTNTLRTLHEMHVAQ